MNIKLTSKSSACGFILVMVLILCAASLLVLVGVMSYTNTTANLNVRNNQLAVCRNAAEAATEKVYAKIAYDFTAYGLGQVSNNLVQGVYRTIVPTVSDDAFFGNFNFSDTTNNGYTYVGFLTNYTGAMPTQYTNSFVSTSPIYRIVSNVTMTNSRFSTIIGTAQEDVLLALVPITTYAIFYNGELEFTGCADMTVNGRTHSNADICTGTSASCTFNAAVTCCSVIQSPKRAIWGAYSLNANTTYNAGSSTNVVSVAISIPMTNTHSIIEIPPSGELANSTLGLQREYNKANVFLIVSNLPSSTNTVVTINLRNPYNGNAPIYDPAANQKTYTYTNPTTTFLQTNLSCWTNIGTTGNGSIAMPFLNLTNKFYDQRESKTNLVTQIDIGAFAQWATNNIVCSNKFVVSSNYPTILYVVDNRTVNSKQMTAVRLVNAQQLPFNNGIGFSVATLNPLYIQGHYNITVDGGTHKALAQYSTTNTFTTNGVKMTYTVPAALIADSITILSTNWQDNQSTSSYSSRPAPANLTMNAAIVVGNVPSTGTGNTQFSGGVHNLTRLLEDWDRSSGYTLTYNTSIVCLYASQTATNQYLPTGQSYSYYSAPTRNWGFDQTYYNPGKQPPGVPAALVPIRFNWTIPPPATVTSN